MQANFYLSHRQNRENKEYIKDYPFFNIDNFYKFIKNIKLPTKYFKKKYYEITFFSYQAIC